LKEFLYLNVMTLIMIGILVLKLHYVKELEKQKDLILNMKLTS